MGQAQTQEMLEQKLDPLILLYWLVSNIKNYKLIINKLIYNSNYIYRNQSLKETAQYLGELIEAASQLTLAETEDWFDGVTVGRHMKHLGESYKIFEKTAQEMSTLQQRLESAYEDIGGTLNKYYDIGGMVTEASGEDYQKFFSKAMKKFKIQDPADLEQPKQKKRFFNWVDKNYVAKEEPGKEGAKTNTKK